MSDIGAKGPPSGLRTTAYDRERLEQVSARYVISPALFEAFGKAELAPGEIGPVRLPVIIEVNLDEEGGRRSAHDRMAERVKRLVDAADADGAKMKDPGRSRHHIFARLSLQEVQTLVAEDTAEAKEKGQAPAIYKVWQDRKLDAYLDRSIRIIKADACLRSFGSDGDGVVWAVADSGIQGDHPHFETHGNLALPPVGRAPARSGRPGGQAPLDHRDFTVDEGEAEAPLEDGYGHGTHVAGIIAGASPTQATGAWKVLRILREKNEQDEVRNRLEPCTATLQGVAPKAKLVSLKVLDAKGDGQESSLLSAIDYVARVNDDGRWLRIHGLNLSLGYGFDAEWFAAGQSPLCVAVNRLVKQGVAVVVAAGNDGSALIATENSPSGRRIGMDQSITDPGNAEYAITVGSTHPEQPHTYGVSYFSSRGPTADGRQKPDLIAPGEHILSAASPGAIEALKANDPDLADAIAALEQQAERRQRRSMRPPRRLLLPAAAPGAIETLKDPTAAARRLETWPPARSPPTLAYYRQESGTSMAAPHVSGAIAAFLSVRPEFIGQPERVKEILMSGATDLKRRRDFQGAGLLDLLRAIQSV